VWIEQTDGAKFRLRAMNGLKNRGVEDTLNAVTGGLKGWPNAITATLLEHLTQAAWHTCPPPRRSLLPEKGQTWRRH